MSLAILAVAGTIIYQTGAMLLSRVEADLDRSSAITNLHAISVVFQARGTEAVQLIPFEDRRLHYEFAMEPAEEHLESGGGTGFYWATLRAVDLVGKREVESLAFGFDG